MLRLHREAIQMGSQNDFDFDVFCYLVAFIANSTTMVATNSFLPLGGANTLFNYRGSHQQFRVMNL